MMFEVILTVLDRMLCRKFFLFLVFIFAVNAGWGQGSESVIICDGTITLDARKPNINAGQSGYWQVSNPAITWVHDPAERRIATFSNIPVGSGTTIWYTAPNTRTYHFYITRTEPNVYFLTAPAIVCGDNDITLTLSGSDNGFRYYVYSNGEVYPGASPRNGNGGTLTWDVDASGTYTVEGRAIGNEDYCRVWMDGEVQATPMPLPQKFQLTTPDGPAFCDGSQIRIRLENSDNRVAYQLYYEGSPVGGPRSGGSGTITWNVGQEGEYRVTGTNVDTGCQSEMTNRVALQRLELPARFDISPRNESFCSGTGPVQVSISGSQSGVNYQLRNLTGNVGDPKTGTGTRIDWSVSQPGRYSVLATRVDNQCTDLMIYYADITEIFPYSLSADGNPWYCQGEAGVDLLLSPSSQLGVTYILYKNGASYSQKNGTGSPLRWENMQAGEYRVTAMKDGQECDMYNIITITEIAYAGNVDPVAPICRGESVQLNATGGISFSWVPAEGLSNTSVPDPWAAPQSTTTYNVTITNASGCSGTESVTVTVNELPTADAGSDATICAGETVQLRAAQGAGYQYQWSPGGSLSDPNIFNPVATPAVTTDYLLRVTNAHGCEATDQVRITVNPIPHVNAQSTRYTICAGESAELSVTGTAGLSYLWSNGSTSQSITVTPGNTTTWTVTGTNTATGCRASDDVTVTVNPLPVEYAVTGGGEFCEGGEGIPVGLNGSQSEVLYELFRDGTSTGQSISGTGAAITFGNQLLPGIYTVNARNSLTACTTPMNGSAEAIENRYPGPAQSIQGTKTVCPGTVHNYSVPVISRAESYIWSLPSGAAIQSGQGTNSITVHYPAGAVSGTISVRGINDCGEGTASHAEITVRPLPAAAGAITGSDAVCVGSANEIYSIAPVAGATSYTWELPPGAVQYSSGSDGTWIIVDFPNGSLTGDIIVTPRNGCGTGTPSRLTVNVIALPNLVVNSPSGELNCSGDPIIISASSSTAGVAWSWTASAGGNIVSGHDTSSPEINMPGTYRVEVTASGCTSTGELDVTRNTSVPENVMITKSGDKITCNLPEITLTASSSISGATYRWSAAGGGNIKSGALTANPVIDRGGHYTVYAKHPSTSCEAPPVTIIIEEDTGVPDVSTLNMLVSGKITCSTESVVLSTDPPLPGIYASFEWSSLSGTISNTTSPQPTVHDAGVYTLTVTGQNGCIASKTVEVFPDYTLPGVWVNKNPGTINCQDNEVRLEGGSNTPGAQYQWTGPGIISGATTATPRVNQPGTYVLRVTHPESGCFAEDFTEVVLDIKEPEVFFPDEPGEINCTNNSVTIESGTNAVNPQYQWFSSSGQMMGQTGPNLTVTNGGRYTLRVRDLANHCFRDEFIDIPEDKTLPGAAIATPGILTCNLPEITLSGSTTSGTAWQWTTSDGQIKSGANTPNPVVTKKGYYNLRVTGANGCISEAVVNVGEDKDPPVIVNFNNSPAAITCSRTQVQLSGGAANATLLWTGPPSANISNPNISNPLVDTPGTYTLTATGSNGCPATKTVTVPEEKSIPLGVAIEPFEHLSCSRQTTTLTGTSSTEGASYRWEAGPGGNILSGTDHEMIMVGTAATYTLFVAHPLSGCETTTSAEVQMISQAPVITLPAAQPERITCNNQQEGIQLQGISVDPEDSDLLWTGPGTIEGNSTLTPRVYVPGTYTLTATHPLTGCKTTRTVEVGSNLIAPVITSFNIPGMVTCSNPEIEVVPEIPAGDYSYLWETGSGTIKGSATGKNVVAISGGTYTLTVTDLNNGCSITESITVGEDRAVPHITVDPDPPAVTCKNPVTRLYGTSTTSGATYSWTGPGNIIDQFTETPGVDLGGEYILRVTNPVTGCFATAPVTVGQDKSVPAVPQVMVPAPITCNNEWTELRVSPHIEGVDYKWTTSDGGTILNGETAVARVNGPGLYTVTVTSRNTGCTSFNTVTVIRDNAVADVTITGGPYTLTCSAGYLELTGSSATGIEPAWTTAGGHIISDRNQMNVMVNAPGDYILTVNHPDTGCPSSATITVDHSDDVPEIFTESFPDTITCATGTVSIYGRPADPTHTFEWSTPDGRFYSGTDGFDPVVDMPGRYVITVTDPVTGCTSRSEIRVIEDREPATFAIAAPADITCTRNEVQLSSTITSADQKVTYLWTTEGGGTLRPGDENAQNPVATSAGTYKLIVTRTSNGCPAEKSVTIKETLSLPHISVNKNPEKLTCDRTEVVLSGNSDTPGATFRWTSDEGHPIVNSTSRYPRVSNPGWYELTVTHPESGCTDSRRVEVVHDIEPPHIHIEPGNRTLTCIINSVRLEGNSNTENVAYLWTGPGGIIAGNTRIINVSTPGTYTLTVTRIQTGCTASDQATVLVDREVPTPPSAGDAWSCSGSGPAMLEATGSNIRWYSHSNLHEDHFLKEGNTLEPSVALPGDYYYYATQTGTNGCESSFIQVRYTVRDLPPSPLGTGGEICEGASNIQLKATGSNIRWYQSLSGPLLAEGASYTPDGSVTAPGAYIYYISQTDSYGCESDLSEIIYTIRPRPDGPIVSPTPQEVCAGEVNPHFNASGSNIRWYGSQSALTPLYSGNEYIPTVTVPGNYTWWASQTSSHGCESARAEATLVIKNIPQKFNVTGGGIFCENSSGVIVGLSNSTPEVEYTLWLDGSTVVENRTGTGSAIDFGHQNQPGTYTVTATNSGGCTTAMNGSVTAEVRLLPGRPATITGPRNVCQGSINVPYHIEPVDGATHYIWELPQEAQMAGGAGTNSIIVDFPAGSSSGAIRVRAVNGCGEGPVSADLYISVSNLPAAAGSIIATPSNSQVCRGEEEVIFEVPAIEHAISYGWSVPAGATIVQGNGSRSIKVRFSAQAATGEQVVRVRGINSCGNGAWSPGHIVTVFAPPQISAGVDRQLCSDQATLSGTPVPPGGSAFWETVSGYGVFSSRTINNPEVSSLAMGENLFSYTVTVDACSVTDTVALYNNRVLVNAGSDMIVCSGEAFLEGSPFAAGSTGLWSIKTGSASFENAGDRNTRAFNLGQGDNILYWSITKNGCVSRDSVIITNHSPVNVNAGHDITTCNGEAVLNATEPAAGHGEWKVISGRAFFDDPADPRTRVRGLERGINSLAWVVKNNFCSLGDTVLINNIMTDVNAGEDQELCDSRATLYATPPPAGMTGEWSVARGSITFMDRNDPGTRVSGVARGINEAVWTVTSNGCAFRDTVRLVNNMPTPANAGPNQDISINFAQLEANEPVVGTGLWSVMNGSATFSDPALATATVTNLAPGPNTLRWTISYGDCKSSADVTINNGSLESIYAGEDQALCSNETRLNASEPAFGFGLWSVRKGSARFENNEQADTRVYDLAQGENILRWSVTIGSTEYYDEVTIINNLPSPASAGSNREICADSFILTGNLPVVGTGLWTIEGGSAIIADPALHNSPVSELALGNNIFRWTITHENCVSSDVVIISNDIPTTPDAGPDQFTCTGTAELYPNTPTMGTAGWSVLSGAGSFDGNFVSGLANGENRLLYTITKNRCSLSDEVVITSYRPTAANAGRNMNVCTDEAVLNANQPNAAIGETGRWTVINGSGTFDDPSLASTTVRGLAAGKNVFRWTIDNQGCTSFDEIEISYDFIQAYAGVDIEGCESEVLLNANNPGIGLGEWSVRGGSGSAVFDSHNSPNTRVSNLDRGNNILRWTITNNRCVSWDEITVRNNSPSPAYAGADRALCDNEVQLQARSPIIGTGNWSVVNGRGEFDNELVHNTMVRSVGTGSNTYRWTVENEGCTSVDEVVIRNNMPLHTFAGEDQVLCADSAFLAANLPDDGQGVWSIVKGAGVLDNPYGNTTWIRNLAPDENILRWTVTNGQCSDYSDVRIVNNMPTTARAGADRVICDDHAILEGNIPVQGLGSWSIISGSGTFEDHGDFATMVSGLSRGTNILRWTIRKETCVSTSDVVIRNDMPTMPDAGADITVCGNLAPLNGNMPVAGTGHWTLVSGSGTFDDPSRYNTTIRGLGQGTNILQWTISNNSCVLTDRVSVMNNTTDVYAGPDQITYSSSTTLSANIPSRGTGIWSVYAGGGNITSPYSAETRVEGLHDGVNTFVWSVDIDGCISSDDVRITYYKQAASSFTVSQAEGCPPHEVRFTKTITEDYPFRWELGEGGKTSLEENPVHVYELPGRYVARLFVTGPDGKEVSSERLITVHEPPVSKFELAPVSLYIPGGELRTYNYSTGGGEYLWDFGDGNTSSEFSPVHTYRNEGNYNVSLTVWSDAGCTHQSEYHEAVKVESTTRVRFPSAFTPNQAGPNGGRYNRNDYSNQVFYPVVINGHIENFRLEIFNRWGVLLFTSNDVEIGWDGYYREQPAPEDVYVYRVTGILTTARNLSKRVISC